MSNELTIGLFIFIVTVVAIWMIILGRAINKIDDRSKKLTEMQDSILGAIEKKTMGAILWGMPNRLVNIFATQSGL